jgi:membrane associated rhomboid family serine protease
MWACGSSAPLGIWTQGEWWRLFTAIFLHGSVIHLLMNAMALNDLGRLTDQIFGPTRLLVAFLLTGLVGSTASSLWMLREGNTVSMSLGSSGAICGLLGLLLCFSRRRTDAASQMLAKGLLRSAVLILVIGLVIPFIDNAAHMGGFVSGYLLGFVFRPTVFDPLAKKQHRVTLRATTTVLVVATLTALAIGFGFAKERHEELAGLEAITNPLLRVAAANPLSDGTPLLYEHVRTEVANLKESGAIAPWRNEALAALDSKNPMRVLTLSLKLKTRQKELAPDFYDRRTR